MTRYEALQCDLRSATIKARLANDHKDKCERELLDFLATMPPELSPPIVADAATDDDDRDFERDEPWHSFQVPMERAS